MTDSELAEVVWKAFGAVERPDAFTDADRSEESAEHDETLRQHTPEDVPAAVLENPGWDPLAFALPEAFHYYFRGLIRLALEPGSGCLQQFMFHATFQGLKSPNFERFDRRQRLATLAALRHLRDTRPEEFTGPSDRKELADAVSLWEELAAQEDA